MDAAGAQDEPAAGTVSIFGLGSLLSETSARRTMPSLRDFRLGWLQPGYVRAFSIVRLGLFKDGGDAQVDAATREVAALAARPVAGAPRLLGSVFEVDVSELPAFYEREHRYQFHEVQVTDRDGPARSVTALLCVENTDEQFRRDKFGDDDAAFHEAVGRHYAGRLWGRPDVLPHPRYLQFCVSAAEALGQDVLDDFLDTSVLVDGETTIRAYLAAE